MADQTQLLSNILNALSSIDVRLSRIETTLHIPPLNNTNVIPPTATIGPLATTSRNNAINIPQHNAHHPQQTTARAPAPTPQPLPLQQLPTPSTNALDPALIPRLTTAQQQHTQPTKPQPIAPPPPVTRPFLPQFHTHPGIKPLEPPPEGFPVSSRAALQEELDNWTVPRGYSMRINGTRTHGQRSKIRLVCFRGGRARARARSPASEEAIAAARAAGKRKPTTERPSKKCDCPFRFELVEISAGAGRFSVHFTSADGMGHNHGPSADLRVDPRARKIPVGMVDEVDGWLRAGRAISGIQEELRNRGVDTVLDFDLRNRKRTLQRKDGLLGSGGGDLDGEQAELGVGVGFGLEDEDADGMDDE